MYILADGHAVLYGLYHPTVYIVETKGLTARPKRRLGKLSEAT
jgi:hypothetical protein